MSSSTRSGPHNNYFGCALRLVVLVWAMLTCGLLSLLAAQAVLLPRAAADPSLDADGKALLAKLQQISKTKSFIFGHHNTDLQGEAFEDAAGTQNRSDVATATGGIFPGMYGYNLAWVAEQSHLTPKQFETHVIKMHARGAVLHMYWQASNPTTCDNNGMHCKIGADDPLGTNSPITAILPGGSANDIWVMWMDRVAAFFSMCAEKHIAAVFRPFHENTGV